MAFLTTLGKVVNEQFGMGDRVADFGQLSNISKKIDQSAQRTYIEDGLINNYRPRMREIFFQQPDITLVLKKRMFSSLVENSRLDLLESNEKLLLRATKRLFHNKCKLISAYERLSKIEKISVESGQFNTYLAPIALQAVAEFERAGLPTFIDPNTRAALDVLRKAIAFSDSSAFTSWTTDYDSAFSGELGDGTGTIELTNVSTISTRVSTTFGQGSCTLSIEDPYKLMHITNADIDRAIAEASSFYKNSPFARFTEIETRKLIDRLKNQLDAHRAERGASPIRFIVSPVTINSKKVRAIIDSEAREIHFTYHPGIVGIGGSVELDKVDDPTHVNMPPVPDGRSGKNGLNSEEASIFKEIIKNTYLLIGFEETTKVNIKEFNHEMNYVRNRMRLFYGKKSIIQAMDVVNVFVTTRTSEDNKLTEGFPGFQGNGQLNVGQKINNLMRNINNAIQDLRGGSNNPEELEKAAIVGPNFPTWLWRAFRNNLTKQSAGTAVFVGIVNNVSQTYMDGKYSVNVNCSDNTGYFNKSQINIKPALDTFNGTLYDPLTPFDVSFDAATGMPIGDVQSGRFPPLLPENIRLLETGAVKFKTTDLRGQNANQILYRTKRGEVVFGKYRRVLADSDGFVYRWKQGIQTMTKTDRAAPTSSLQDERSPLLTKEAFAGQDVMNVLSLLITGQPYNFNTFLKAAISNANDISNFDPTTNSDNNISYIDGIINDLTKRNVVWGNFIPFKGLSLNDETYQFIQSGQTSFIRQNQNIQQLLKEKAALEDQKALRFAGINAGPQNFPRDSKGNPLPGSQEAEVFGPELSSLDSKIDELNRKIEAAEESFNNEINNIAASNNGNIKIIGDDISLEPGFDEFSGDNSVSEEQRSLARAELRRKINTLTQRRLWKVKANNDTNLFVVDDQYDKNFDIMAFERKLGNAMQMFNSEYMTVDSQIRVVADILGLEVFADSQGNIQARPPLYNKMPSSVFFKMFKDRAESGIKVFPDFLETLLFNQVGGITDRIEIVEDQIRLRALALGIGASATDYHKTDEAIYKFLRSNVKIPGASSTGFHFLTDPDSGKISPTKYSTFSQQADADSKEDEESRTIGALEGLNRVSSRQAQANRIFDITTRTTAASATAENITRNDTKIAAIRNRLQKNKGIKPPTVADLFSNDKFKRINDSVSAVDRLRVYQQIASFVSERQKLIKQLSSVTKNLVEGLKINQTDEGAKTALTPFLNRKNTIPSFLEHMIEDETLDDLGPGSGSRYVIKESQIIKLTLEEKVPDFTATQVNGLFGEGFVDAPSSLNTDRGGNAITSAYAVDYDMWRQYGLIVSNSVEAPFFSDPESQCAPYAVSLLNRARKKIFSGSLSIAGKNEFYQAGDVIYLEDYDLLFYVESVAHSFTYNSIFQTTLELSYGHNPGEYIPTPLDIIGSNLYKSQNFSEQFRSSRFNVSGDNINLGAIIIDQSNPTLEGVLTGPRGAHNRQVLSQVLFRASGSLNKVGSKNSKSIIELRTYSNSDGPGDPILFSIAEDLKNWFINPSKFSTLNSNFIGEDINNNLTLNPGDIEDISKSIVNLETSTKSPSGAAWHSVRLLNGEKVSFGPVDMGANNNDRNTLVYNIIDIWMTFKPVPDTLSLSGQNNQAAQESNAVFSKATGRN